MIFKPITFALRTLIRIYQLTLSAFVGRNCRFLPSCSEYTSLAIEAFGPWAGIWLGLSRFCRCRPGATCGFDPVPEKLPEKYKWWQPWQAGKWR